ncbi:MAG: helix-turn-helix transcriptional regulator [Clostridia bacterium]|nr:helix-turn-helix transcriptional regulator [Clostridia bacterium]
MEYQERLSRFLAEAEPVPTKALKQHWNQKSFSYQERPRPDYGLMLLLHGEIEFATWERSVQAKAGDLVFLPKQGYYEARFLGAVENYLVNFDAPVDPTLWNTPTVLLEHAPASYPERFRQCVEERYSAEHTELRAKGLLYLLLDELLRPIPTEPIAEEQLLAEAQALLKQEGDLPIREIARACCISESGLRRLFRKHLALSPTQYRIEQKLSRAAYLLDSTDLSVGELAARLNFFDAAYFCKVFRRRFGMTPRQYAGSKRL